MNNRRQRLFLAGSVPSSPALAAFIKANTFTLVGQAHSFEKAAEEISVLLPDIVVVGGDSSLFSLATFLSKLPAHKTPQILIFGIPSALSAPQDPHHPRLSRRETQTLLEITRGFSTKQIADHLGIGCRTVETYRNSLKKKLNAAGPAALAMRAVEFGFVKK